MQECVGKSVGFKSVEAFSEQQNFERRFAGRIAFAHSVKVRPRGYSNPGVSSEQGIEQLT